MSNLNKSYRLINELYNEDEDYFSESPAAVALELHKQGLITPDLPEVTIFDYSDEGEATEYMNEHDIDPPRFGAEVKCGGNPFFAQIFSENGHTWIEGGFDRIPYEELVDITSEQLRSIAAVCLAVADHYDKKH